MDTFTGFPAEGLEFLEGLAADNTRVYFEANRPTYEKALLGPAKAFVVALGDQLHRRVSKHIVAEPKVNGSIMRINRDTRFSKDKTPYKTTFAFTFWEGAERTGSPGYWLGINPDHIGFGSGVYGLEGERLERYRSAVAANGTGNAIAASAAKASAGAKAGMSEPKYKRVPTDYDPDHPRADLLRHAGFYVWQNHDIPKSYETARFVGWCATRMERLAPIHRWFVRHVA